MIHRRQLVCGLAAAALLPSRAFAEAQAQSEIRPELAQRFADEKTTGAFVGYKVGDAVTIASDSDRAGRAILPASTFKIANSLIALETGVVSDPDTDVFKWDGVTRNYPDWNRDHTLRSAIAVSAVPVYQEIARRIGPERMQDYLQRLDYGNHEIGGGIDQFWLTGDLRISPLQQVGFLDRLRRGALPLSSRSQQKVRDILSVTKVGDAVIRAKTGLVGVGANSPSGGADASVGWLVGFAEQGSAVTVFALNCDIREPRHIAARMAVAQQCLKDIEAI